MTKGIAKHDYIFVMAARRIYPIIITILLILLLIRSSFGTNLLRESIIIGNFSMCRILIFLGAPVNIYGGSLKAPIHYAVEYDRLRILQLLLRSGAEVDSKSNNHHGLWTTPLMYACLYNRYEIAKCLILHGASINAESTNTETPLEIAVENKNTQMIELLIGYNADVNKNYIFSKAVRNNLTTTTLDILLAFGANINNKYMGRSPMQYAQYINNKRMVDYLKAHGAK